MLERQLLHKFANKYCKPLTTHSRSVFLNGVGNFMALLNATNKEAILAQVEVQAS